MHPLKVYFKIHVTILGRELHETVDVWDSGSTISGLVAVQ